MTRDEVKTVILRICKQQYDLDIDNFAEDAPLADLQNINPKIDSLSEISKECHLLHGALHSTVAQNLPIINGSYSAYQAKRGFPCSFPSGPLCWS